VLIGSAGRFRSQRYYQIVSTTNSPRHSSVQAGGYTLGRGARREPSTHSRLRITSMRELHLISQLNSNKYPTTQTLKESEGSRSQVCLYWYTVGYISGLGLFRSFGYNETFCPVMCVLWENVKYKLCQIKLYIFLHLTFVSRNLKKLLYRLVLSYFSKVRYSLIG